MKAKRSISGKILTTTIVIVALLSGILVSQMARSMKSLTDTILSNVLPSMTKTASQSVEGNMHMLADRIFMIGDNEVITSTESTVEEKQAVLDNAQTGIEFLWLGLYDTQGNFYLGAENCPQTLQERKIFPLLQETQNLVIDDIVSTEEGLELAVGTPISNSEGELLYYLVGSYKYDVLNDVLSSINISANGEAFIVNSDGQIMGHRNTMLIEEQEDMAEHVNSQELEDKVVSGETGVMVLEEKDDTKLVSYVPINGTNWFLTIIVPRSDFMGPANNSIKMSVWITIGLLIGVILFIIAFSSQIKKSLKIVTNRIELLAQGDLKTPIKIIKTKDETQVLSYALSNTIDSINGYISELSKILFHISEGNFNVAVDGEFNGDFVEMKDALNRIIVSLNTMLLSVQDSSREVLKTAGIVSESALQVHTGSTEQSNSLTVLKEETKAIEENISEVDQNTRLAGDLMEKTKDSIGIGDENMKNLLKAMEDINKNSLEITKVNKLLENIAFQTNILALNASVEAGRAGEAGKGFAVVAAEVRSLAAQSTESAKHATEVIDSSLHAIERGVMYAKQAADSFTDIEDVSSQMSEITKRLEETVAVQKESLENMAKQITQINDFAQQNLDASYESTTASQKLHEQAKELQNVSGQFQLRRFS